MALGQLLVSAIGLLAVANAHPAGLDPRDEPTTTITMTQQSTYTLYVPTPTDVVPEPVVSSSSDVAETGAEDVPEAETGDASVEGAAVAPAAAALPGIAYAPYAKNHGCKAEDHIKADLASLKGKYSYIRIYGTDCNQVALVSKAAKANGLKVFLGIWDINNVANEAKTIISAIGKDWSNVHTVSVTNELVNNGQATPGKVIAAVKQARTQLRAAGYQGPVVSVDTFVATIKYPELCKESDYCAINAHAFFDSTNAPANAGKWLANEVANVRKKIGSGKKIVVTETGWPMKGSANGKAVPGLSQQKAALSSIRSSFASTLGDVVLFSAFNDLWKPISPSTYNAEPYWGIDGAISASDK